MSKRYEMWPVADDHQHNGLGNTPETIKTLKIQPAYDEDGRECGSMLTFQRTTNDTSGHRKTSSTSRDVLFPEDGRRDRSLRARPGVSEPRIHADRQARYVHAGSHPDPRQAAYGDECARDRRVKSDRLIAVCSILGAMFLGGAAGMFVASLWSKGTPGVFCAIVFISILIVGSVQVYTEMRRQK